VQLQRHLGPLPLHAKQYARFAARAHVLHITGLFNAPWRQQDVRASGLLRSVLTAVMRQVNLSHELSAEQRACAALVELKVLESGLV